MTHIVFAHNLAKLQRTLINFGLQNRHLVINHVYNFLSPLIFAYFTLKLYEETDVRYGVTSLRCDVNLMLLLLLLLMMMMMMKVMMLFFVVCQMQTGS